MPMASTSSRMSPSFSKTSDRKTLAPSFSELSNATSRKSVTSGAKFPAFPNGLSGGIKLRSPKDERQGLYFDVAESRESSATTTASEVSHRRRIEFNGPKIPNGAVGVGRRTGPHLSGPKFPRITKDDLVQPSPRKPPQSNASSGRQDTRDLESPVTPVRNTILTRQKSNSALANGEASRTPRKKPSLRHSPPSQRSDLPTRPPRTRSQSRARSQSRLRLQSPDSGPRLQSRTRSRGRRVLSNKRKRISSEDESDDDGVSAARHEFAEAIAVTEVEISGVEQPEELNPDPATTTSRGTAMRRRPEGRVLRQRIIDNFDKSQFDKLIYQQAGAAIPPSGVAVGVSQTGQAIERRDARLYLPIDPRIHWTQERSDEWYRKKRDEISRRPKRKANFGQAVQRMAARMKEARLARRSTTEGLAKRSVDPHSKTFGRNLDFGDVPEDDLPDYVKVNPAWRKACAWMRDCKEKSTQKQRELSRAAKRQ